MLTFCIQYVQFENGVQAKVVLYRHSPVQSDLDLISFLWRPFTDKIYAFKNIKSKLSEINLKASNLYCENVKVEYQNVD